MLRILCVLEITGRAMGLFQIKEKKEKYHLEIYIFLAQSVVVSILNFCFLYPIRDSGLSE